MKNLKTFEKFSENINIGLNESVLATGSCVALGWLGMYFANKLYKKYSKKKLNRDYFKSAMNKDGTYTNRRWNIKENGDQIILKVDSKVTTGDVGFIIDKKNKTIEYESRSTDFKWKVKLSDIEFTEIMSGINFAKEVIETIKDCFYELTDNGYRVELGRVDFNRKSFVVDVIKEHRRQHADGTYAMVAKNISFTEMGPFLEDVLYRITSQYGVEIDKEFKDPGTSDYGFLRVIEYTEGMIKLSNKDVFDASKGKSKFTYAEDETEHDDDDVYGVYHPPKILKGIILPFVKK